MPLTIETGSGVTGANSFATLAQAREFALLRGVSLTADDDTLTAYLVKANDYLKSLSYLGTKTYPGQGYLPWPRTGLVLDDEDFPEDAIPTDIVSAACQLCIEQHNGVDLSPTASGPGIKRDKTGPLETEYVHSSRATTPRMPLVDALLQGWVAQRAGIRLSTLRV